MKENVLDVLIYLFENYMFDAEDFEPDQETLITELSQAGFEHSMIDRALEWLENLALMCDNDHGPMAALTGGALRHYVEHEQEQIGTEARGLLLKLEQCGVLDAASREMVIDRLMALGAEYIEIEHVKWVILMVLSNYTHGDGVSEATESLVLDEIHSCLH